ncbi:MAG: hypothetical protein L3J39_00255 [Verrucomicrobiales bacterium]|nr:hypothetical protein [Verrucomicrobiales bacterium]
MKHRKQTMNNRVSTWQGTRENHYDNPSRRDRRLYALDEDGKLLRSVSPFKPY